ncbi:hypothetical protein E6O75_ATG01589 [Venturia nashicola]|uniref:Uncharacterized protein n=1 Tax=Venturia nashicola TaxID=86259 RepID=A0A4Z1PM42_9PEZI|nr:hypothetical protein E6O75_ATG01589 [Venturia nashicola]
MYSQDSFDNSAPKAVWVVDEGTADGITRRFVLRKEIRTPKTAQSDDKTETYAKFAMIFGSHNDTATRPQKHRRLSVLDECEEEVESERRDTMYEEVWDDSILQSVIDMQALDSYLEPFGQKTSMKRNSWKNRFSSSSLTINTSPGQTGNLDSPISDRAIIKTVTHTTVSQRETPTSHHQGTEDSWKEIIDKKPTNTTFSTCLELERERISQLFDDDLHQTRLMLIREKYVLPEHRHVFRGSNDSGLRLIAGNIQYRIRILNHKFTSLWTRCM